jgi:hypothetical protein
MLLKAWTPSSKNGVPIGAAAERSPHSLFSDTPVE